MANRFKRKGVVGPKSTGSAAFIEGFSNSFVKKQQAQQRADNDYTRQFVMQNMKGESDWQMQEDRQEHQSSEKMKDRKFKVKMESHKALSKAKTKKFKIPPVGVHAALTTGIRKQQMEKGWTDEQADNMLSGWAKQYGYVKNPKPTKVYGGSQGGFMKKASKPYYQTLYSPPDEGYENDEEDNG